MSPIAEENKGQKKPYPVIDKDKCKGCGTCASVCPVEVFVLEKGKSFAKKPDECIGCHACASQCPVEAIKIIE